MHWNTFIICAKRVWKTFCRKWRSSLLTTSQFPGPNALRTDSVKIIMTTAGSDNQKQIWRSLNRDTQCPSCACSVCLLSQCDWRELSRVYGALFAFCPNVIGENSAECMEQCSVVSPEFISGACFPSFREGPICDCNSSWYVGMQVGVKTAELTTRAFWVLHQFHSRLGFFYKECIGNQVLPCGKQNSKSKTAQWLKWTNLECDCKSVKELHIQQWCTRFALRDTNSSRVMSSFRLYWRETCLASSQFEVCWHQWCLSLPVFSLVMNCGHLTASPAWLWIMCWSFQFVMQLPPGILLVIYWHWRLISFTSLLQQGLKLISVLNSISSPVFTLHTSKEWDLAWKQWQQWRTEEWQIRELLCGV